MKFRMAVELLHLYKHYVEPKDIADALYVTPQAIRKRIERDTDLKENEAYALAKHFELPTRMFFDIRELPITIPVDYWESSKIRLNRAPNIPRYDMSFEVAYKYNRNFSASQFKIICMRGDSLNGGQMWIRNNDLLLLDVSRTDLETESGGIFAYECAGGEYVAMAYVNKKPDGALFTYTNPEYKPEFRDNEFLERVKFRVIGRVIKNLFFFA